MKPSYVLSAFVVPAFASPTVAVKGIDIDDSGRCRIFSLSWLPVSGYAADDAVGIQLYSGDPSGGDPPLYQNEYYAPGVAGALNWSVFVFPEIPSNGILFSDDVWVQGTGIGISAATLNYQVG